MNDLIVGNRVQRKAQKYEMYEYYGKLPVSSALLSRLQIFQPTRKPVSGRREVSTKWGTACVSGRLGQGHADVLEAILHSAHDYKKHKNGTLEILVDPHKVRMQAGGGTQLSGETLKTILIDLMKAIISLRTPKLELGICEDHLNTNLKNNGELPTINSSIIVSLDSTDEKIQLKAGVLGGPKGLKLSERSYWCVTFSKFYVDLLEHDIKFRYKCQEVSKMRYGISQAIARHIKTHKYVPQGGYILDKLINAVGGGKSARELSNQRSNLKKDAPLLEHIGIFISNGRVRTE